MKDETLAYLRNDLLSLLEIMNGLNEHIFLEYSIELTRYNTISSLALHIFLYNFIGDKQVGLINKLSLYEELKNGYYGGLSEVYKPYGENLYYYDVNSLYPYAALNDMPGREFCFVEDYSKQGLNLEKDQLFGFFYCQIETNNDYLGILPKKIDGRLCYPNGKFEGWYFSPLIELAQNYGYKIKIIKGYNFERVSNVFEGYVNHLYSQKASSKGVKRLIIKLLLNSLLGRFGLNLQDKVTSLMTKEEYCNLLFTHKIYNDKWIIPDEIGLISHSADPDPDVCHEYGVDYVEYLNSLSGNKKLKETEDVYNVSVAIAAAVTSYSSIYMTRVKKYILDLHGEIFYMDTDSIVTNIPLHPKMVGPKLGQFKLEYRVLRAYFITSKTYCLVIKKGNEEQTIIKIRGVLNNNLNEITFIRLYKHVNIIKGTKISAKRFYDKGYVSLEVKRDININPEVFKKRDKIFNKKGI